MSVSVSFEVNMDNGSAKLSERGAKGMEKLMKFLHGALGETRDIIREFDAQTEGSNYIPSRYFESYDLFGDVWFQTGYFEVTMVSFNPDNGHRWRIVPVPQIFEDGGASLSLGEDFNGVELVEGFTALAKSLEGILGRMEKGSMATVTVID